MILEESHCYEERRRQDRFQPKQRTYVVSGGRSGLIVNINISGLAFDYIARRFAGIAKPELSIVCCDEVFCEKLSFKAVYDHEVPNCYDDRTMVIKRCGVNFENLATAQRKQLEQFLHRFAD